jgi:hypothetical protein
MNQKLCTAAFLLLSFGTAAWADSTYQRTTVLPHASANVHMAEKKKAAVKLYPNPSTNGTVRVVSNTAGNINFYIFEMDGTLLHQAIIGEGKKHTVTNLKKGVYTYDVFYNDEGIEHGKLIVK